MSALTKVKKLVHPRVARRNPVKPATVESTPYGIASRKLPVNCGTVGDFRAAASEIGKHADWNLIAAAHAAREL